MKQARDKIIKARSSYCDNICRFKIHYVIVNHRVLKV